MIFLSSRKLPQIWSVGLKHRIQQRSFYEQNSLSYTSLCRTDLRLAKALLKSASAGFPSHFSKKKSCACLIDTLFKELLPVRANNHSPLPLLLKKDFCGRKRG